MKPLDSSATDICGTYDRHQIIKIISFSPPKCPALCLAGGKSLREYLAAENIWLRIAEARRVVSDPAVSQVPLAHTFSENLGCHRRHA